MRFRNSSDGYGAAPQILHWLTVGLVALAWALGTFDDVLPKGAARAVGLFVHNSAGLAILAVLVVRLVWRLVDPPRGVMPCLYLDCPKSRRPGPPTVRSRGLSKRFTKCLPMR